MYYGSVSFTDLQWQDFNLNGTYVDISGAFSNYVLYNDTFSGSITFEDGGATGSNFIMGLDDNATLGYAGFVGGMTRFDVLIPYAPYLGTKNGQGYPAFSVRGLGAVTITIA
jgi:hypothetical protein